MNVAGPFFRIVAFVLVFSVAAYPASNPPNTSAKKPAAASATAKKAPPSSTAKELETQARQLKQKNPGNSYARLSVIANQKSSGVLGLRAALALGYYDYTKARYVSAFNWLEQGQKDPLLNEYALFYSAETNIALNKNPQALAQLKRFRKDYPDSVLTEQALGSLCTAALAAGQPAEIVAALDSYPDLKEKPALLLFRAEAYEQLTQPLKAAVDYQKIYLVFPSAEQSREAGEKLGFLRGTLGNQMPRFRSRSSSNMPRRFFPPSNGAKRATNIRACCFR